MIRPFEAGDLEALDLSPEHRALADKYHTVIDDLSKRGLVRTLLSVDGKEHLAVMAIGKTWECGENEGEVFIFPSCARVRHQLVFWRGVKWALGKAQERFPKIRAVSVDRPALRKFFDSLNFKPAVIPARPEYAGMIGWTLCVAITIALEYAVRRFAGIPGVILADPVTAAAIIGTTAAVATTTVGILNYEAAQGAAKSQEALTAQQRADLAAQQQAAAEQAAAQAKTGQSFGFSNESADVLSSGFGFGRAPAASPNTGRGQITGFN